jgi:predicted Rossmann-fold nucleotide-binding protein
MQVSGHTPFQPVSSMPAKDKMVAVLGTTKENPDTLPYMSIVQAVSNKLSRMGYGILTGASPGANYYGNLGAKPEASYAIHVTHWPPIDNVRPDSDKPLYQDYATVGSGSERTNLMNQLCNTLIMAPGGAGSMQELGLTLENVYYQTPGAPQKMILIGKNYWNPLLQLFNNMVKMGTVDKSIFDCVTVVDVPLNNPEQAAEQITKIVTAQKPQVQPMFGQRRTMGTQGRKLSLVG